MAKKRRRDKNGEYLRPREFQRHDGLYMYYYTAPGGQRKYISHRTLFGLRQKEKKLEELYDRGVNVRDAQDYTLNDAFIRYLAVRQNIRENTLRNYRYMYNRFVEETLGKRKVIEIRYSDVLAFYKSLVNDKGLSPQTVDSIHTLIHPTLRMAMKDGYILMNPAEDAMKDLKKNLKQHRGVRKALTEEQQNTFLNYVKNEPQWFHWYSIFLFMFTTGCRVGETIGIRWEDIDFEKDIIDINHSLTYYAANGKGACFHAGSPKTDAGYRQIPMAPVLKATLLEEREEYEKFGGNTDVIDGMSGFIFENRYGHVHHESTLNKAIKRIVERFNEDERQNAINEKREEKLLPRFSCHTCRHTFCTRLCEHEDNLKVIQSIMGHSDPGTTMGIYAEATHNRNVQGIRKLDDVFKELL